MGSKIVLMIEEEQPEGLSARKLVAETARHNVLTSYTAQSGLALLRRFPRVDAVLVHHSILESRPTLIDEIDEVTPEVPILLTTPLKYSMDPRVDYVLDSHNPVDLIEVLNGSLERRKPRE